MAREYYEKPEINVGDTVWINHPISDYPLVLPWLVVNKDPDDDRAPVHWHLLPEDGEYHSSLCGCLIRVRADSVRKNLW